MSTMPTLVVVPDDPVPAYEQLRRQLAALINSGVLGTDERLPPLRQLAGDLGLAVGTVARTYRELETAGLIRSRRGGGTRVTGAAQLTPQRRLDLLDEHALAFVRQARLLGADESAVQAALRRALNPEPRAGHSGRM